MDKDKSNIEFPNRNIIENEIQTIIDKGIIAKESFYSYLKNMYKQIGFRYLFQDITEIIFVILLCLSVLIYMIIGFKNHSSIDSKRIYCFIFIFSPILYFIISLLSFINIKQKNTYEVEMTCKYNIYQRAAFRMLTYSIISIMTNTILVYIIAITYKQISFLTAFMTSVTSLFLFSSAFLYSVINIKLKITKYLMVIGWVVINLALLTFSTELYNILLSKIPIYLYISLTLVGMCIYIRNIKNLIKYKGVERDTNLMKI